MKSTMPVVGIDYIIITLEIINVNPVFTPIESNVSLETATEFMLLSFYF